jgi:ABC-type nickel/cobalt efflux system permease component RcnA
VVLAGLAAAVLLLVPAGAASAHPLGNFTVNTATGLRPGPDRVDADLVVDLAEIPAFQVRQRLAGLGAPSPARVAGWAGTECDRLAAGAVATLDGRRLAFTARASRAAFSPGSGGLDVLRLDCGLTAPARPGSGGRHTLRWTSTAYADRVGWHEITAVGDGTTLTGSDVPARSPSAGLTAYPPDLLGSPVVQRRAEVGFTVGGARAPGAAAAPASGRGGLPPPSDRLTRLFTAMAARADPGPAGLGLALGLAILLGAIHAASPGHGKTIMAAYLVGLRGTPGQAAVIAATVTLTHTAGVLVLGLALSLTRAFAPERLYPWLGVASGLLLAGLGATLLRRALRARGGHHHHDHGHEHGHGHTHGPGPDALGRRGLVTLGFAGGLVPSPSALVVLLGSAALGRPWQGLTLVVAYGAGMAVTLTGAGLLLVRARTLVERRRLSAPPRLAALVRVLPVGTASLVVAGGLLMAARSVAGL